MKLLFENWRKFLEQDEAVTPTKPKVIFMAGAPGVGKSYVRKQLGLDDRPEFKHKVVDPKTKKERMELNIVDPDEFYVPMLKRMLTWFDVPEEERADIEKQTSDYHESRRALKDLLGQILKLKEPDKGWNHKDLEDMYKQILETPGMNFASEPRLMAELEGKWEDYGEAFGVCSLQGQCFSKGQAKAKEKQQEWFARDKSIIIDGTAGFYDRIIKQKEAFEDAGYDVAMVFVDAPLETALSAQHERERKLNPYDVEKSWKTLAGGTYRDPKTDQKVTRKSIMKPFVDRFGKVKRGYEKEFGENYFRIFNDRLNTDKNIAKIKPQFDRFLDATISEDFQQDVKRQHKKMKIRLIGKGGNKTKASPFNKKPSMKRSKSAPPGFGGS